MLSHELRDLVFELIQSNITVEEFEEWLVPRLPLYLEQPNSSNSDVVAAIELGLTEVSDGIKTEEDFRTFLLDIIREQSTILSFYPVEQARDITTSSNQTATVTFLAADVFTVTAVDQRQNESI